MKEQDKEKTKQTEQTESADGGIKITDGAPETAETPETEEITVDALINKLAALQEKAEAESKRAREMTDMAQRLQAEFDNYRKRTVENSHKAKEDATADVIKKIIPVLDVVGQALTMITDEKVKQGVAMIEDEIVKLMKSYGVEEIEASGKEFDPKIHEAIMQAPAATDEERDKVKEVFQKGYSMGDRILRPARVIVNK